MASCQRGWSRLKWHRQICNRTYTRGQQLQSGRLEIYFLFLGSRITLNRFADHVHRQPVAKRNHRICINFYQNLYVSSINRIKSIPLCFLLVGNLTILEKKEKYAISFIRNVFWNKLFVAADSGPIRIECKKTQNKTKITTKKRRKQSQTRNIHDETDAGIKI